MIGKLIFKLPEERVDFELAQKAGTIACFVESFSNKLFRRYKHESPKSAAAEKEYEAIKELFLEEWKSYGISHIVGE